MAHKSFCRKKNWGFGGRGTPSAGREEGAVLIELALMLPFLVFVFIVLLDLGFLLHEHQVLQNAARETARYSSLPKNWIDIRNPSASLATLQQYLVDYCAAEGIPVNVTDVTIDQQYPIVVPGLPTAMGSRVTVSYDRALLIPGGTLLTANGTVTLGGEAVFRNLF